MIGELREKLFLDVVVKKNLKDAFNLNLVIIKKECMDLIGFHMDAMLC